MWSSSTSTWKTEFRSARSCGRWGRLAPPPSWWAGFVPKTESAAELATAIYAAAGSTQHLSAPLAAAIAGFAATPDPGLGRQEQRALVLYASGRSIKEVAAEMGTTEETVKSYIKRARRKFREVGVDVGTRILLRRYGIQEGWLAPE
jgi:two-component system uhpT operon response regulator UhpA